LGLALGADVPFFIGGQNAWVEGIGEQLSPIAVPVQTFMLIKPSVSIETRAVFTHPGLARDTPRAILEGFDADAFQDLVAPKAGAGWGRNDLQVVAESLHPEVHEAVRQLQERFGNGRMSGSGSAVFARTGTSGVAAGELEGGLPAGWIGRRCRSLVEHPLRTWAAD